MSDTRTGTDRIGTDRIGIDLGGTKIEAVRLGADGCTRWRHRVPTPAGSYAATVQAVAALVRLAQAQGGPATVGVGSPGTAGADGRMKGCNSTCLNGQRLQADLQAAIGHPVALANDANCLALSEATDGAGAGADVVFAVILGTGVGAGIAVHGRVLQGPNGLAGEWGHNPLPWSVAAAAGAAPGSGDPQQACWCGQHGCIETLLSGPALARDHRHVAGQALDAAGIAAAAASGDAACRATLDRHAGRLARALAAVINLLDPDVIVLAGGVSQLPGLVPRVTAQWARWVFAGGAPGEPVRTALRLAQHGDASGVRGAAWLGAQARG